MRRAAASRLARAVAAATVLAGAPGDPLGLTRRDPLPGIHFSCLLLADRAAQRDVHHDRRGGLLRSSGMVTRGWSSVGPRATPGPSDM